MGLWEWTLPPRAPRAASTLLAFATLAIPIPFLFLDRHNKRIQRKFLWRARKIHSVLNDGELSLLTSPPKGDFGAFRIYDPAGEISRESDPKESAKFEEFISKFASHNYILYSCMAFFSLALTGLPWLAMVVMH